MMTDPADTQGKDRRRDPRHIPDDAVSALGRVVDISVSGMRIRCPQSPPIDPGQPFKVEVRADDRATLLPVRLIEAYRMGDFDGLFEAQDINEHTVDLGVEFRRLTPAQHREIEQIIEDGCEVPRIEVGWMTDDEAAAQDDEYAPNVSVGDPEDSALRDLAEQATSQAAMIHEPSANTDDAHDSETPNWRTTATGEPEPRETRPGELNHRLAGRLAADDAESSLGKVMDISATGLRVRRRGAAPVRVGSVFMMDLHAAGRTLRAPVEVVRIQKVGWRTFDYGLKFGDLPDDVRAEFGRFARMASKCVEIY